MTVRDESAVSGPDTSTPITTTDGGAAGRAEARAERAAEDRSGLDTGQRETKSVAIRGTHVDGLVPRPRGRVDAYDRREVGGIRPMDDTDVELPSTTPAKPTAWTRRRQLRLAALQYSPAAFRGDLAFCQRFTTKTQTFVALPIEDKPASAWHSNLTECDAVWLCPVCSSKHARAAANALEEHLLGWAHLGADHTAVMATFTMRHTECDSLEELLDVLTTAHTKLMNSSYLRGLREAGAFAGYLRVIEITWGAKGWHPHVHVLFFTRDSTLLRQSWAIPESRDTRGRPRRAQGIAVQWVREVERASASAGHDPLMSATLAGQDLASKDSGPRDAGAIAGYVNKDGVEWAVAAEMTRVDVKTGRGDSAAPLELLMAASAGDRKARRLWQEYAFATKGRHRLRYSATEHVSGRHFTEVLAEAYRDYMAEEGNAAAGWGDSPRAVATREAKEAQKEAESHLSTREWSELKQRERECDAAARGADRVMVSVATFDVMDRLGGSQGRLTEQQLQDSPQLLLDLLTTVEYATTTREARALALAFVREHGLPLNAGQMRRRQSRSPKPATRWPNIEV